jgi:hypothetical protein
MRTDWIPYSASALVIGAMSLVLGSVLNPADTGATTNEVARVVASDSQRWLAMAVLFLFASFALILGLPCVLTLFGGRGGKLGVAGVALMVVGAVGTCGYATLMLFFRSLVLAHAVKLPAMHKVITDAGLRIFLTGWVACFYGGVLVIGVALLFARRTPRWVPVLLLVFVAMLPFSSVIGRVGTAAQIMCLAVAFTGIAMTAVSEEGRPRP